MFVRSDAAVGDFRFRNGQRPPPPLGAQKQLLATEKEIDQPTEPRKSDWALLQSSVAQLHETKFHCHHLNMCFT
jgi:hypothetical protein